jgi:hypothetical protein
MRPLGLLAPLILVITSIAGCDNDAPPTTAGPSPVPPAPSVTLAAVELDGFVVGGQPSEGRVALSAPAPEGGLAVSLSASDAAVTLPSSISVPAGALAASFRIATSRVTKTIEVTITAQAGEVRRSASIRVRVDPASIRPTANYTIGFAALTESGARVTSHAEFGFAVTTVSAEWSALGYGNPRPSIQYTSPPGVTTTGEVRITADGAPFWFASVDLYSSTTRIPHVFEGSLDSEPVYTVVDVLGNTFGNFVRVRNPHVDQPIDALVIRLSNPAAPCCRNPVGIDNVVLSR